MKTLYYKRVDSLKKATIDKDPLMEFDEDKGKYISNKSPLDPSTLGFDDYLVRNTYEDQQQSSSLLSQFSKSKPIISADYEKCKNSESPNKEATQEVTSKAKNLPSTFQNHISRRTSYFEDECQTTFTQLKHEIQHYNLQHSQATVSHPQKSPFLSSQIGESSSLQNIKNGVTNNLTEVATNANSVNGSFLYKGSQIGVIQNCASLFKTSNETSLNHQQPTNNFITFKPSQKDSPIRNPFPQKFKKSPLKHTNGHGTMKIEDLSFQDNIRLESECYIEAAFPLQAQHQVNSPKVFSQHSVVSPQSSNTDSGESANYGCAKLTLSQLHPVAEHLQESVTSNEQIQKNRPIVTPPTYLSQLVELPSLIQEDSQEFSYSHAKPGGRGLYAHASQSSFQTESIVKTQESQFQSRELLSPETDEKKQNSLILIDQSMDSFALSRQSIKESFIQNESRKNTNSCIDNSEVSQKAYISDGRRYPTRNANQYNNNMEDFSQTDQEQSISLNASSPKISNINRKSDSVLKIKNERQSCKYPQRDQKQVHQKSTFSQDQNIIQYEPKSVNILSMPYFNVLQTRQKSDAICDIASALLHQLSSQQDHFSQRDLALLTSISSRSQSQCQSQIGDNAETQQNLMVTTEQEGGGSNAVQIMEDEESSLVSMKEHYEAQMRRLKKAKLANVKTSKVKKSQPPATIPKVQPEQTKDAFYDKNVQWRKQIDDVNIYKKQIFDKQKLLKERRDCTFKPNLKTKKFNESLRCASSPEALRNEPVEHRCLQWADHAKKKKLETIKRLEEFTECTFNPTLISKEFKKRVCPNYDFQHKDMRVVAELHQEEYKYFTLKNYLKLNDESKHGLEKLCQLYSSNDPDKKRAAAFGLKEMTDREKMMVINEFIERSEAWREKVQLKRAEVAQKVDECRNKENTFHPQVNAVSELLHGQKLKMLNMVNKAAFEQQKQDLNNPIQMGLVEKEAREHLFEYYLPKSKLVTCRNQKKLSSSQANLPMQIQSKPSESVPLKVAFDEVRPLQQEATRPKSKEARENKHPSNEIDFGKEARRFNRLIDLLSYKLSEKPELRADFMPRQMPKIDERIEMQQPIVENKDRTVKTFSDHMSFQEEAQHAHSREAELVESVKKLFRIESKKEADAFISNAISSSLEASQETSRFINHFTEKALLEVSQLDFSQLKKDPYKESEEVVPSITDLTVLPDHFEGSRDIQQSKKLALHEVSAETYLMNGVTETDNSFIFVEMPQSQNTSQDFGDTSRPITQLRSCDQTDEAPKGQTSTSMRKHLDYIYKRNLQTTRMRSSRRSSLNSRGETDSQIQTVRQKTQHVEDFCLSKEFCINLATNLSTSEGKEVVSQARTESRTEIEQNKKNLKQIPRTKEKHNESRNTANYCEKVCLDDYGNYLNPSKTEQTEVTQRYSRSNTSNLFKKRDKSGSSSGNSAPNPLKNRDKSFSSQSRHSGSNTINLFKKRQNMSVSPDSSNVAVTARASFFKNEDIADVIMQEHLPAPNFFAKAHTEQLTARSVKEDQEFQRLSEKLRGLKKRQKNFDLD